MKTRWKILIGLGIFLLLGAVSVWFSAHMQPSSAVDDYKKFLRAHGEKVTLDELIPQPVPAASNSLLAVQGAFGLLGSGNVDMPDAMKMIAPGRAMIGHQQPLAMSQDFTNAWEDFNSRVEVILPAIDLLHQVLEKPHLDFNLDYKKGFFLLLPHLPQLKRTAQQLDATIICQLNYGETAEAVTNLMTMLAITERNAGECITISELVRIAIAAIAVAPTWELLQATNVTDAQLAALQKSWRQMDFISQATNIFAWERAWGNQTIERARSSHEEFEKILGLATGGGSSFSSTVMTWPPDWEAVTEKPRYGFAEVMWRNSWSYADELNSMKTVQIILETLRAMQTNRAEFYKADYDTAMKRLGPFRSTRASGKILETLKIPTFEDVFNAGWSANVIAKVIRMETAQRIVITAIALKRFQLKHGHLPEKLSKLTPEFLPAVPIDPYSGKPLCYRLIADGSYLLYSVAENGADDGGDAMAPSASASPSFQWQHAKAHDWVWPQPATATEIKDFYDAEAAKAAAEAMTDPAIGLPPVELPPPAPPGTN